LTPREGYVCSMVRESRDRYGRLTYVGGLDRLELIKGMQVYNTRTDKLETL
jgi:hypothetical protein